MIRTTQPGSGQSVSVGESILDAYADVDVIICNDSTALPGQCKAAENKGLTAKDITITVSAPRPA